MIRCAVYCRVSTDDQNTSIVNQQNYFTDYIKRYEKEGYVLSKIYTDEGISGSSTNKRESFKEMIQDGANKKYDCLLAKSYSRFGRNVTETLNIIKTLMENNVHIVFVEEGLDSIKDFDKFALFAWMAENEIRKTSERIKMTWDHYDNNAIIHACHESYGYNYDKVKKDFVINESEAEVIKDIFDMYVNQGYGFTKIANILRERGIKTKKGGEWANPTISGIIKNPIYIGHLVQGKSTQMDVVIKKRKKIDKDKWKVHENRINAIIDESTFYKAQVMLQDKSHDYKRKSSAALFSNLIKCGECGSSFTVKRQKHFKNYSPYYTCIAYELKGKNGCGHSRIAYYEGDLVEFLKPYFEELQRDNYQRLREMYQKSIKKKTKEKDYEKELKKIEKEVKSITKLSMSSLKLLNQGVIKVNQYKLQSDEIEKQLQELEVRKTECLFKIQTKKIIVDNEKELIEALQNLMDQEWTNETLRKAINQIIIYQDKRIEVKLRFHHF